mgnify:FL=1
MAVVVEDLERGHRITFDLTTINIERIFRVTDLADPAELQLIEALGQASIPVYYDLYPLPADPSPSPDPYENYRGCRVISRVAQPDGPQAALVTIGYTNDFGTTFSVGPGGSDSQDIKQVRFSVSQRTTTVDRDSNPMLIPAPTPKYAGLDPYLSTANINVGTGVVAFERTESSAPDVRMQSYVGKLNSIALGAYAPETLLCSAIDGNSTDNVIWTVSYEFEYDAAGWKHVDRYHDSAGAIPAVATDVTFDVLETIDFTPLGLDF